MIDIKYNYNYIGLHSQSFTSLRGDVFSAAPGLKKSGRTYSEIDENNKVDVGGHMNRSRVVRFMIALLGAQGVVQAALAGASGPAEDEFSKLEEIIVTAQKRAERLQDVPSSVSVLGAKRMLETHQTSLTDYAATIPGLQVASDGPGRSKVTMRGLSLGGSGATVGTYIDEVPFGSSSGWQMSSVRMLELLPYSLERLEVLRGPQGTMYGANALGGLIKYVTRAPDLDVRELSVGADFLDIDAASESGHALRAGGNLPLLPGVVGLRVGYARDFTPGYQDMPARGAHDINETTRQTGTLALLWQANEDLSIKFAALAEETDADDSGSVRLDFATKRPLFGDLAGVSALRQPFKTALQLYSATVKYDFGWSELTSASSYTHSTMDQRADSTESYASLIQMLSGDPGLAPLAPTDFALEMQKFTQEVRLATPSGERFEALIGLFYTEENAFGNRQRASALDGRGAPIPGLDPLFIARIPTTYEEYAAFGNLTYKLTERLDVSAGVRYARNDQELDAHVIGSILPSEAARTQSSESVFNFSIAPRYRFNDDCMVYLRVATGYRPGSANLVVTPDPNIPNESESDRITNYELGVKSAILDGRLMLNVAAFEIDWEEVQLTLIDPISRTTYDANARTARSRGLEVESILTPLAGLSLGLSATYTDAELTEDLPLESIIAGTSGDRLPDSPRFSGAATVSYDFALGAAWQGQAGGTLQYVGSRYSAPSGDPSALRLESYSTAHLNVGLHNDVWSFNLFARNVANKRAYVTQAMVTDPITFEPSAIAASVLQPRTIGLSVDRRF